MQLMHLELSKHQMASIKLSPSILYVITVFSDNVSSDPIFFLLLHPSASQPRDKQTPLTFFWSHL